MIPNRKNLVKTDSRRRVTLSMATPGDAYQIKILETGQIELTPVAIIPKRRIKAAVMVDSSAPCQIIQPE
jgi:hypothetical protein